jgi:hypothetical protein
MGVDFLVARGQEFRGALSVLAPGGIPATGENLKRMLKFDVHLTADEFNRQLIGDDLKDEADRLGIPGIYKKVVDPLSPRHGEEELRFSVGQAADVVSEVFVDPFFLIGAAPRKLLTPVVTGAAKGMRAASLPFKPVTRPLGALLSQDGPVGGRLVKALSPHAAWKPIPETIDLITIHGNEIAASSHKVHDVAHKIHKKFNLGRVMGRAKNPSIDQDKVWQHLQISPQRLNEAEKSLVGELKGLLRQAEEALVANGDDFFRYKNINGRQVKVKYDAENLLRDMRPLLHGVERLPSQTTLNKLPLNVRNQVHLPWRNMVNKGDEVFQWQKVGAVNRDPLYAVTQFLEMANKRVIYHRRVRDAKGVLQPVGLLEKYKLTADGWHAPRQNKLLAAFNAPQFENFVSKVHQITGHSRGRETIAHSALNEQFIWNISKFINPKSARYSRVVDLVTKPLRIGGLRRVYEDGTPVLTKQTELSAFLVKNQMIALLGYAPGSAVKNTSQLLSTAAIKGVGATMRGLYQMAGFDRRSKLLRSIRKDAGLGDTVQRLVSDETMELFSKWERTAMWQFNMFENTMRGTAFNIYAGEVLDNMARQGVNLSKLTKAQLTRALDTGILGANKTNFTYGIAGRSEWMARPAQRVAFSLQSYNWKFAGFANDLLMNDPTAFSRLVALHGWAIEQAYLQAGINAESWLGWGFADLRGFGKGPAVDMTANLLNATIQKSLGNDAAAERAMASVLEQTKGMAELGEVARIPGWMPFAAYVSSVVGVTPFPVLALSRFSNAVSMFMSGEKRKADDEFVRHMTPDDIVKSVMFQLHEDVGARLESNMKRKARNKYNFELNRRVNRLVKAGNSTDAAELKAATEDMFKPIAVQTDVQPQTLVGGVLANLVAREGQIVPRPQDVLRRVRAQIIEQAVPRASREMLDDGWLEQVILGIYGQQMLERIETLPEGQGQ